MNDKKSKNNKNNEALQLEIAELKRSQQLVQKQTHVLDRALNALTAEPDIDKFLEHVLIAITQQLAVSSCVIWLYNPETKTCFLHMMCSQGQVLTEAELQEHPHTLKPNAIRQHPGWLTDFKASHRITSNKITNYCNLDPQHREYLIALGVKGLLEVPLALEQEVIGCLAAYNTERESFTTAEIELAQALAHQGTLAIQLTRLVEQVKQKVQQSAILEERNRIAGEIHNSLRNLQEVLAPSKTYSFDSAKDVPKVNCIGEPDYLLQNRSTEESAETIPSINQNCTQFEPSIQDKIIKYNKLEKPPLSLLELTPREQEVLQMIATGANNREIAQALCLSEGTVRNHISNILSRLNVRDRTQAALIANTFLL